MRQQQGAVGVVVQAYSEWHAGISVYAGEGVREARQGGASRVRA